MSGLSASIINGEIAILETREQMGRLTGTLKSDQRTIKEREYARLLVTIVVEFGRLGSVAVPVARRQHCD